VVQTSRCSVILRSIATKNLFFSKADPSPLAQDDMKKSRGLGLLFISSTESGHCSTI
jgi:hypothetical protein